MKLANAILKRVLGGSAPKTHFGFMASVWCEVKMLSVGGRKMRSSFTNIQCWTNSPHRYTIHPHGVCSHRRHEVQDTHRLSIGDMTQNKVQHKSQVVCVVHQGFFTVSSFAFYSCKNVCLHSFAVHHKKLNWTNIWTFFFLILYVYGSCAFGNFIFKHIRAKAFL